VVVIKRYGINYTFQKFVERAKMMKQITILFAIALLLLAACSDGGSSKEQCRNGIVNFIPTELNLQVNKGTLIEFSGEGSGCDDSEVFTYRYNLSNETISEQEVSEVNTYTFLACDHEVGRNTLKLTATDDEGIESSLSWQIQVADFSPTPPACYSESLNSIKNGDLDGSKTGVNFEQAVECLEGWTDEYVCDTDAHFAITLAKSTLLASTAEDQITGNQGVTTGDIYFIFIDEVDSMRNHLEYTYRLADESFSFIVDYFLFEVFSGEIDQAYNAILILDLAGEYDYTEVALMLAGMNWATVGGKMMRVYEGTMDFMLSVPNDFEPDTHLLTPSRWGEDPDPSEYYLENEFYKRLAADPQFLKLRGENGEEGALLLQEAREHILKSISTFNEAMVLLTQETDDQSDDMLRYWDCGLDAICPGDQAEPSLSEVNPCDPWDEDCEYDPAFSEETDEGSRCRDINNNQVCDPAHAEVGADGGEGNNTFDAGEQIGFAKIQMGQGTTLYRMIGERITMPFSPDFIANVLEIIAENLTSGEPLVPDRMLGGAFQDLTFEDSILFGVMDMLGIPVPAIRLAEFFDTPSDARDFIPVYETVSFGDLLYYQVHIDRERETYQDVGLDRIRSSYEDDFCQPSDATDPVEVCYEFGDFGMTEPLCVFCNFDYCHQVDALIDDKDYCGDNSFSDSTTCIGEGYSGVDNNFNGVEDEGMGIRCDDNGPEDNRRFDYIDLYDASGDPNPNGVQDPLDPCEPFADIGIGSDAYGAGNQINDEDDMSHDWPPTVPYTEIAVPTRDPRNGVALKDPNGKLIDEYYLFIPDATFSGVLIMQDELENPDGETINDNGKFMRLAWKIMEQLDSLMGQVDSAVGW
jgi:hypothetical protein